MDRYSRTYRWVGILASIAMVAALIVMLWQQLHMDLPRLWEFFQNHAFGQ